MPLQPPSTGASPPPMHASSSSTSIRQSTRDYLVAEELLLSRFGGVPAIGLRCAQAASAIGVRFSADLVAEVLSSEDISDVDAAFAVLSQSGLVRIAEGRGLEFVHPLFRQALYNGPPPSMRARLHER